MDPEIAFVFVFAIIFLLICLVPVVFYLLTLQNTLKEVSDANRKMPPGQVWLQLIPLFGTVWQFIIVNRLADSLRDEFASRNIQSNEDRPGFALGLTTCILTCMGMIPYIGMLFSLGGLVCWIIYWVKVSEFKRMLQQSR